jgi:head-tail adaptor
MIGHYRYQIELLARAETPDGAGGAAVQYAPVATVWSAVDQLSSVGGLSGDRARRLKRIKAWVRSRPDFKLGARLRHQGDLYQIVSIESDDERGRRVFLICEEALS